MTICAVCVTRNVASLPAMVPTASAPIGASQNANESLSADTSSVFEVTAPSGSIVNAERPAAVQCRHVIGQMLPDVVFGCLVQALPDAVPAEGASCLWNATFQGSAPDPFVVTYFTNGGTGARPVKDGLSATAYPSGVRCAPIEVLERIAARGHDLGDEGVGFTDGRVGIVHEHRLDPPPVARKRIRLFVRELVQLEAADAVGALAQDRFRARRPDCLDGSFVLRSKAFAQIDAPPPAGDYPYCEQEHHNDDAGRHEHEGF